MGRRLVLLLRKLPGVKGLRSRTREELAFIRHVYRQGLWHELLRRNLRRQVRRLQKPLVFEAAFSLEEGAEGLAAEFTARGMQISEGGHALYVPPQAGLAEKLGSFVTRYPASAGFKILKNTGAPDNVGYVQKSKSYFWLGAAVVGKAMDLLPVGNFLYEAGIGPRIYDLAEVSFGGRQMSMFVMEHVRGREPKEAEWRAFMQRLGNVLKESLLRTTTPDWEHNDDFAPPDCNRNLLISEPGGQPQFVDTQNFIFADYEKHLMAKVQTATGSAHFGHKRLLRVGSYLYQQVPGVAEAAKRATRERWLRIQSLLAENNIPVERRLILDVGCNTGMMLAEALNEGAHWGIGWDKPEVIAPAQSLLWALGYTRHTLVPRMLDKRSPLWEDVPGFLQPALADSVMLYLAIRHHIGFIDAVKELRWKALVYEGSQDEGRDHLREIINEFRALVPGDVIDAGVIQDGDCTARPLLLFLRR